MWMGPIEWPVAGRRSPHPEDHGRLVGRWALRVQWRAGVCDRCQDGVRRRRRCRALVDGSGKSHYISKAALTDLWHAKYFLWSILGGRRADKERWKMAEELFRCLAPALGVVSSPGASIMEAYDRQVTTVFTVQQSFHHRHSTNRVSWSVTIVGKRRGEVWLHVRRWW